MLLFEQLLNPGQMEPLTQYPIPDTVSPWSQDIFGRPYHLPRTGPIQLDQRQELRLGRRRPVAG